MPLYATLNVTTYSLATLLAAVALPLLHLLPRPVKVKYILS